jgi:RHS repeat-associated protein
MALFCPVASRIRHIAAQMTAFKSIKHPRVMPRQRRWLAASAGAALLIAAIDIAAAQMAIPGKFQVNAAGAATYSIPIAVPPGIAGMTPSLTLEYNSQGPNGILGMGWSLGGLPVLTRCAATIAQDGARGAVTYTSSDRFCLDGQRLVAISGGYGGDGTQYRTEVDSFSRIVSHGSAGGGPAWFEVRSKSGQIMQFGNTADSKIMAQGTSTPRAWAVNSVSDTVGNSYTVQYQPDANGAGQAYPQTISYAGNTISFVYAGGRPDTILLYEAGAQQKVTMLLTNVQTSAPTGGVADYRLAYQQTSSTHRSYLSSVTLCDRAAPPSCLPATTIGWNAAGDGFSLGSGSPQDFGGRPPASMAQGDVNGDGCGDLIEYYTNGASFNVNVMLSNCNGTYSGPYAWTTSAGYAGTVTLADVDGDGRADLVISFVDTTGFRAYVALSNGQTFGALQGWGSGTLPNWDLGLDHTYDPPYPMWSFGVADINGDGRADLVAYGVVSDGTYYYLTSYVALATGGGNFAPATYNNIQGNFAGATLTLADINGDGRMDLVASGNNVVGWQLTAAISNGDGTFTVPNGGSFNPFNAIGWHVAAGDLNGDGRTDFLLYRGSQSSLQVLLAFSRGDGTFAFQFGTEIAGNYDQWTVTLADLNGDGRADLVPYAFVSQGSWFTALLSNGDGSFTPAGGFFNGSTGWSLFTPDVNGDGRSDVVLIGFINSPAVLRVISFITPGSPLQATSFATGIGATTNVTYAPLTTGGVYTKGSGAVYPLQDTQGALYVVSRVDAPTGIANPATYTSFYGYYYARFDLAGRGFLGFQQMNIYDAQTGITAATGFNQNFPLIGTAAWEWKGIWPNTLNSTSNTYQFFNASGGSSVSSPSIASAPYRVSLASSAAASNDLDGTALPTVTTTYQYDAYNNPTQVVVSTPDGYSKTTTNTYSNDTTNWFLARLTLAQVASTAPAPGGSATLTRTSSFAYSSSTGLLTQEVVEPNTPALRLQTDYLYDAFGNKAQVTVSGADIATRSSTTSYAPANGSANGQFPTGMTNALNQSESWQYTSRFGTPTSHTGPNGLTTTWQYDTFGRKILEVRADGTKTTWGYFSFGPGQGYYIVTTPQDASGNQNGPLAWSLFDGLNREYYRCTQGFDVSSICVQTVYDGFGRVQKKSRPYFYDTATPLWTTYSYDVLARVTTEALPDGHTIQHGYHGLVTSDTNQNNQTRTVTKNSQGQVISVADAQGHVTSYSYDPVGNLTKTVDATGANIVTAAYDLRGRKTTSTDPDLGTWTYSYDVLGQLKSQVDAIGQVLPDQPPSNRGTKFTYDLLGRLAERDEYSAPNVLDMSSSWTYDTAPYGIGKVASATASGPAAGGSNALQRTFSYDNLGRPTGVVSTIDGYPYHMGASYDGNGRLSTVQYLSGFVAKYTYTSLGYVQKITDVSGTQVFWTANARDAELHLTRDTAGNGIVTARGFDAPTGRLTSIVAGSGNGIVNFSYGYDALGNPLSRADGNTGVTETFSYDSLNRLTSSTVSLSPTPLVKNFAYDSIGNLLTKSDVGNYTYPAPGQARPHAVLSVAGDTVSATFSYDGNGNQINATGIGRNITYNVANKAATITQGSTSLTFYDDVEHQRYKQIVKTGTTTTATTRYTDAFGARSEAIVYDSSGTWQVNDYLMVSGSMVGMRVIRSDGSTSFRYFHQDHLGSIAVITNESGTLAEARDAYDAWGKRRNPNGSDDPTGSIVSQTSRGFTGEEMLASVGLVHLNGRVYDPFIARMTSADPIVGEPLNGQTWNRYSYVWNNPLAYTDPTGYCPTCIGTVNPQPPSASGVMQLVESGFKIAVAAMCMAATEGACAPFLPLIAGSTSAYFAGVHSGKLGVALKAGVIAYATAYAFQQIGIATDHNPGFDNPLFLPNVFGHALVGCASNAASGGKCGPGALAAAVTAFAGPVINGQGFSIGSLFMNTALGGLASVAGGGKFANGAVTAAFGYLANNLGGSAGRRDGATGGDSVYTPPEGTQLACPWCLVVEGVVLGFHAAAVVYDAVVQDSIARGREGEAAVRAVEDIGDKIPIQINGRTRIPDGLTNTTLTEIKNVRVQYFTRQLRDFADYADQKHLQFNLYTRPDTILSEPLQNAINAGRINLRTIPQ